LPLQRPERETHYASRMTATVIGALVGAAVYVVFWLATQGNEPDPPAFNVVSLVLLTLAGAAVGAIVNRIRRSVK
jgi:hypothetical protein